MRIIMIKPAIKKLVGLVLVLALSSYTILGFFQLYNKIEPSVILKKISVNPYFAAFNFNKATDKIRQRKDFSNNKRKNTPVPAKKAKKSSFEFLLFINTFLISNNGLLILFTMAFVSLCAIKKTWKQINTRSPRKPPDIVFYKNWILKFITPMEKCIQTRSEEYDINPLRVVLWEKSRTLNDNIRGAGFFYA
jgi:hypothetical protein